MMHQRISKKFLTYFFILILLTTIFNKTLFQSNLFEFKNVEINGLDSNELIYLSKKINDLKIKNIFFSNEEILKNTLDSYSLIEKYYVFKNYPSSLKISVYKTKFIAKLSINGEFFFIGTNGKLIKNFSNKNNLPFIFGNPTNEDILKLYSIVLNSKFKFQGLKNLFFYKSGRWDIETLSGVIVKLPRENLSNILNDIFILDASNNSNNNIIDARVPNQVILYD